MVWRAARGLVVAGQALWVAPEGRIPGRLNGTLQRNI